MPFPFRRRQSGSATDLVEPAEHPASGGSGRGRLAQIDELTRANRQHRDPAVEGRLVALRNEAFGELELGRGAVRRPADAGDLFAGTTGPPEVSGRDLTVGHVRSGLGHHGSLLVRDLIAADDVARLAADIDHAFEARSAFADSRSECAPWYVHFQADSSHHMEVERWSVESHDGVFAADSPRTLFDLIDAYQSAPIGAIAAQYLGERPALSVKKTTLRRVTANTETQWWHQDGSFLGRVGSLNIWLALSHCGEDAPGLDVVGRRVDDILDTGTEGADMNWSIGQPVVDRAAQGAIVRPVFRPGDALLFDELLVHRTAVDPSMTATRYAIESWFFAPSSFPDGRIPLVF